MTSSRELEEYFVETGSGKNPVKQWILTMSESEREKISREIKKAKFYYKIGRGGNIKKVRGKYNLWRIGTRIGNRNVRIFFFIIDNTMVILHGFFKKENHNYKKEIEVATSRMKEYQHGKN